MTPKKNRRESFELWCEFEDLEPGETLDPDCDYADVMIIFGDGRKYLLKLWTFAFVAKAAELAAKNGDVAGAYLLPPDLLVRRLDRETVEKALKDVVERGEFEFSDEIATLEADDIEEHS